MLKKHLASMVSFGKWKGCACTHRDPSLHHQLQRGRGENRTYQDGGKFPLPLVTKILSPPFCLAQSRGTRPSRDAQRKGGDSRGSSEITQGANVSRSHAQSH